MKRFLAFVLTIVMIITAFSSCADLNVDSNLDSTDDTVCAHEDKILDHICDICGELVGVHADRANDGDHRCDYCNAVLSLCDDADNNGSCDECVDGLNSDNNSTNDSTNDSTNNSQNNQNINMDFQVTEPFDTTQPITITFYHTMGQRLREVLDKYIEEFNKLYPNITVNHMQVGGYDDVRDQIKTEIAVGGQPNIAYCYPDHVALYNMAKATVVLDNLISSTSVVTRKDGSTETLGLTQAQIDDFIKGYYEEGKQFGDGKMYTLPLSKSTEVLYYNKTFFENNNIKVPTTWDEMEEVCKKIKEIDPDCIPLGYDSESNWFITMCAQLGSDYTSATGDHFKFNNETNRNFVEVFRNWYQQGYVTTQELLGGYTSSLFTKASSENGNSYMSIASSAGATHQRPDKVDGKYPFEVGIATIPQVDASNPKVISQGPSLCIFNKENTQEVMASWLFVKYLTTCAEFQAEFSVASGYVPVIKFVNNVEAYKSFLDNADGGDNIAALAIKLGLAQESSYYAIPAFNGSSVARDQVGLLMQKCFVEKAVNVSKMIAKAFEDAVAECEYQAG